MAQSLGQRMTLGLTWHDGKPMAPEEGDAYYDTVEQRVWVRFGGHWIESAQPPGIGDHFESVASIAEIDMAVHSLRGMLDEPTTSRPNGLVSSMKSYQMLFNSV